MSDVEFYFDYSCPWTYLAFTRLTETAARSGAEIVWRPIMVDRVRHEINPAAAKSRQDPHPSRARYQAKDLADWANFCGLSIKVPDDWPPNTEIALSGAVLAADSDIAGKYSEAVFRSYFSLGRDISQSNIVLEIAESIGLTDIADQIAADGPAHTVRDNEASLIERGGFGSPTMFVGDAMFFGNDRMPLVEFALGQASGRSFVLPGKHG